MRALFSKPVVCFLVVLLPLGVLCWIRTSGRHHPEPSPEPLSSPLENFVATVNGQPISQEVWQQHLARRGPAGAKAALDDLIRQELLFQRAKAAGYDRDPQLLASFRRMVTAKFEEEQLAERGDKPATAQDARLYYDAHRNQYRAPEKRRAAVLFLRVPRTASAEKRGECVERAHALRQGALQAGPGEGHFAALAVKYSDDQATRYGGGDLGWLAKTESAPRFGPALTETLFGLTNPGEVSQVIEVPDGFCFVKLLEQQPASFRRFEDVREALVYQLTQQRQQQARAELDQLLRDGAEIRINEEAVHAASVAAKASAREPKPPRTPSL